MNYYIFLLFLLIGPSVSAEEFKLFEFHKKKFTKTKRTVPNRLYSVWEPSLKYDVLRITDEKGKFPERNETVMAQSILDGQRIGADPGKHYRLEEDGSWTVTQAPEDIWFWIPGPNDRYFHRYPSSVE